MDLQNFENESLMGKYGTNCGKPLNRLQKVIEEKYSVKIGDRNDFHKWSVENLAEFWSEFWDFTGVVCSKRFDQVIDLNVPMEESPEWFSGARLNMAENLLKYKDDRVALIAAGEDKVPEYITFAQLTARVTEYAAAFRKLGIKKGDVVACYISNRAEPIMAMNATVSIGAIWTGTLPLLGVQAVINKLELVKPKILLTIDRFQNDDKEIDMLHNVKEIVDALPSLEKVIIVPSKPESKLREVNGIRGSCFLDEFLESGRNADGTIPPLTFEQVSFSYPVFICFTTDATGEPKPLLHGCGVLFLAAKDLILPLDYSRDSLWMNTSPVGWVSWNMLVALSFCGIPLLLYEGVPYFRSPTYLWDLIDEFGCTHLIISSRILDGLEKRNFLPSEKNHLRTLKVCFGMGSVVNPQSYDFINRQVKSDLLFSSCYGSTEVIGTVSISDPAMPVFREDALMRCLGVDIQCVDETGKPIEGEVGELIIAKPYPALPLGIWDDPEGIQFRNYFKTFPGKFAMNDFAKVNPITKGFTICGRSDDTVQQRGTRFVSSEIYNIVKLLPEISDSICTSQYNNDRVERAVLFLKIREGYRLDENLLQRIRNKIASELTPNHVPEVITVAEDIPYSVTGKKLEIVVKNIINDRPFHIENLRNPECLNSYINNSDIKEF